MMLIVLDKNPVKAAQKVPDKIKFKQLLELCQMLCSCGYCDVYKKVNQGKAIQEWIKGSYHEAYFKDGELVVKDTYFGEKPEWFNRIVGFTDLVLESR